jgi:hypothetical protein
MELKGKALFNLFRISWLEDRTIDVSPWQIEDLRDLTIKELFSRLKQLGIILNEESFYLYAENCETPEELVDYVWIDEEDLEGRERAYLLIFELWRRLLPDKFCLSIFCDQLDQLIELYDNGTLQDEEALQNALFILEDILDDWADQEGDPKKIFKEVASYCAHDIERFIADYISDQIAEHNETYASELIDDFYEYVSNSRRFHFLKARMIALSDVEESHLVYERLLEELQEHPDSELILQLAESLIHHGDVRLFMRTIKQALPLLRNEEEFQTMLTMVAEYYRCLDRDQEEQAVNKLLQTRSKVPLSQRLDPSDQALHTFSQFLSKKQLK